MSQDNGEKTEQPSSKKKEDARKRGDVSKSQDLIVAGSMVILFAVVKAGMDSFTMNLRTFTGTHLAGSYINRLADNVNIQTMSEMFSHLIPEFLKMVLPILAIAMIAGIVLNVVQTGFILTGEKLKPNFNKINPIEGFKRIFSVTTLVELLKSIIKITILAIVIYKTLSGKIQGFRVLAYYRPAEAFSHIMGLCATLGVTAGGCLVAFALADIIYQWWKHMKDLRMTKQEVKEENKQLEGDPQVKGRIRQIQRQMSRSRMMKNLAEADVVITNPTHYAVALRYREKEDPAPIVVAKGQDYLAQKIKEVAAEHKITIVENVAVARALYAACEIGQAIPAGMYQAVADILVYVYKLTNRMPGGSKNPGNANQSGRSGRS